MLISVIIPHLNQPTHLERCLASVQAQQGHGCEVEIFVVDNGSHEMPDAVCSKWPNVTLLQEKIPGPGPARNRGIVAAKGDLLTFIDADCLAGEGWLAAIKHAFDDPEAMVIGGDVQVGYADPDNPTFIEPYEAIYSYRNNEHIAEGFSGTGNLAMRPYVHAEVGPFAGLDVAEDRDWGLRACAKGYPARYVPEMIIFHPARDDFADLKLKWDRHIAHDYTRVETTGDRVRWMVKALAMIASPLAEIPTVITSPRISGAHQRWLAFLCLARVRAYRFQRMLSIQIRGDGPSHSGAWNRR